MALDQWCCFCWSDDDDDEAGITFALREMKEENADDDEIIHKGLYQLAKNHSNTELVEEDDFVLPPQFDPEVEYYRMYTKLGDVNYNPLKDYASQHQSITSLSEMETIDDALEGVSVMSIQSSESLVEESDRLFASSNGQGDLTPREVVTGLKRYTSVIRFERDLKRRREWIRRYELRKFDFDADNRDDAEKALFATEDARNKSHPKHVRLYYYQVAIKYTNDMREKKKRWEEYIAFCDSLKQ